MNRQPQYFLAYNASKKEWFKTTYESLSTIDAQSVQIVPVYENNEQGEMTTWAEYQENNSVTVEQRNNDITTREIASTLPLVRKCCKLILFVFILNIYMACIGLGMFTSGDAVFFGVIGGLVVAAVLHFVVSQIISDN